MSDLAASLKIYTMRIADAAFTKPMFVPSVIGVLLVLYIVLQSSNQKQRALYALQLLMVFVVGVMAVALLPLILQRLNQNLVQAVQVNELN